MNIKSTLAAAMTLAIGASLFTATSASAITGGDYEYYISHGTATINEYLGASDDVVIPSTLGGYPVTTIVENAFRNKGLTSVVIPDSVTTLGSAAFSLNALTSITIGSGITEISSYEFAYNNLTSITIPNTVTHIDGAAFYLNQLTSVTIGSGVTQILDSAFTGSPNLATANFLGNAPYERNSFDTSNPDFTVTFLEGNTGFGTGPTWNGYALTRSGVVASASNATAAVTAGVRSAGLTTAAFDAVVFSHAEQSVNTDVTLSVDDLTGANAGWNVTTVASDLTWSAVTGGPSTGSNLPASALAVTTVGSVTTVSGDPWSGDTGLGALGSPIKVLYTAFGSGAYTAPLTLTLTIPGQASVGTYAGTLTTTISAAP